jgi:hypothetical protein
MVGDVAFVFFEVLLVTLIIHQVLEERDLKARLEKLNMVIGAFFSEVGTSLLGALSSLDPGMKDRRVGPAEQEKSPKKKFKEVVQSLHEHEYSIDIKKVEWESLREFLVKKRDFMLRLLENPNLLEHESFTDLLWAAFHLTEELEARTHFNGLPEADYKHLGNDMNRVYGRLADQWVKYMEHLSGSYPYLFSLAVRNNPFDQNRSPLVQN